MKTKRIIINSALTGILCFLALSDLAQSSLSFQCKELAIDKTTALKCDEMSEDDPNDLAEAYGYLVTYMGAGAATDQRLELRFPTKTASYHWTQTGDEDRNDSLSAYLVYNTKPDVYGYTMQAWPKEFTITVTRYDNAKGGVVEGHFEGTMEAQLSWKQQTVTFPVKGKFHTIRTGKYGSECRKQRGTEKLVINKAVKLFDDAIIQPLQNLGWQVSEETNGYTTQIANHPSPFRPLFLCSDFFDLKLALNPESNYAKILQDSALYYSRQVSQLSDNPKKALEASRNMFRIQNMQTAEITIDANEPYLLYDELTGAGNNDRFTVLHVPGVAYACQLYRAPSDELGTPEESTHLCFGDWKGANMHSGAYTLFPFIHKQQSPYIENFVVIIKAPAAVANEIINKIDWTNLNKAISK